MIMKPLAILALAATALTLTGCEKNLERGSSSIVGGYIQMARPLIAPPTGYFTVEGGPRDVQLVAVTSDLAQRVEMHESVKENGVMTMKPLLSADVPAKGKLQFRQAASI
jgi:copper(I)-binding protein